MAKKDKSVDGNQNSVFDGPNTTGNERTTLSDSFNGLTETSQGVLNPLEDSPIDFNAAPLSVQGLMADQTINDKLMLLRAMNPFVPIMQLPKSTSNRVLVANVSQDIRIPTNAKYMVLMGNADYYMGANGNAAVPTGVAGTAGVADSDNEFAGAMYKPNGMIFYVEEMGSVSVVAPGACIVTASFYSQN